MYVNIHYNLITIEARPTILYYIVVWINRNIKGEVAEIANLYPKVYGWYIAKYVIYCHKLYLWSAIRNVNFHGNSTLSCFLFLGGLI